MRHFSHKETNERFKSKKAGILLHRNARHALEPWEGNIKVRRVAGKEMGRSGKIETNN
jgi:hypothetical protein